MIWVCLFYLVSDKFNNALWFTSLQARFSCVGSGGGCSGLCWEVVILGPRAGVRAHREVEAEQDRQQDADIAHQSEEHHGEHSLQHLPLVCSDV